MAFRVRRELSLDRAEQADGEEDRADHHMQPVEPCRHKEGGAEHAALNRKIGIVIFDRLANGEAETEGDGQSQTLDQILAVTNHKRVMRPCHRRAGQQKDQGHEERHV